MTKTPSINMIFEKDDAGNWIPDSLLYQDILKYCKQKVDVGAKFFFYEMVVWLLDNNKEFFNYYKDPSTCHTPRRNRISARWNRVMKCLNYYIALGLVKKVGEQEGEKGNIIDAYELSPFGKLISALYYYLNDKTQKSADEVYEVVTRPFESEPSSLDKFCLSLYRKYRDNNVFSLIIDSMVDTILSDYPILTYLDLLHRSVPKIDDRDKLEKMVNLRLEAYNELNHNEKEMYLYRHKINIERHFLYSAKGLANYEQGISKFKGDAYTVVLEGFCKNCLTYSSAALNTKDYIDRVYSRELVNSMCQHCKVSNLSFPSSTRLLL